MAELIPYKRIAVEDRKDRGESYTVKDKFVLAINAKKLEGVQARLENDKDTVLYVDPKYLKSEELEQLIKHCLQGLTARDLKSNVNLVVSELLFPEQKPEPKTNGAERQLYEKLQESYDQAQTRLTELREKLEESNRAYAVVKAEKESSEKTRKDLETRLAEAEQAVQALKATLSVSLDNPEQLEYILEQNQQSFTSTQETLIAQVFYTLADAIEGGLTAEVQQEIEKAKTALAEKQVFYTAGGEATLQHLPESARKLALQQAEKEWAEAEKTIKHYGSLAESLAIPYFPVRLARRIHTEIIMFPVYTQSASAAGRNILESIGKSIEKKMSEIRVTTRRLVEYPFAAMQIEGRMEDSALKTLITESASLSEYSITPSIFETRYLGEIPPKARLLEEKEDALYEFAIRRVAELGFSTQREFAEKKGINPSLISSLKKPASKRRKTSTIAKLAEALEVSPEELRAKEKF